MSKLLYVRKTKGVRLQEFSPHKKCKIRAVFLTGYIKLKTVEVL